jgi:hypothetical protein
MFHDGDGTHKNIKGEHHICFGTGVQRGVKVEVKVAAQCPPCQIDRHAVSSQTLCCLITNTVARCPNHYYFSFSKSIQDLKLAGTTCSQIEKASHQHYLLIAATNSTGALTAAAERYRKCIYFLWEGGIFRFIVLTVFGCRAWIVSILLEINKLMLVCALLWLAAPSQTKHVCSTFVL